MKYTDNKAGNKHRSAAVVMIAVISVLFIYIFMAHRYENPAAVSAADTMHQAVWISVFEFDELGLYNKSEIVFKDNVDRLFKRLKDYGFNNVYFHVRAYDDAIYQTDEFDWCTYIAKKPLSYDALKIVIETSHKYNIRFHAWINPYRVTPEKILNPAKQSTIDHITAGVKEIIEKYDVDGIHFDDYFYPSKDKGNKYYSVSIKNRKKYVNRMVQTVYAAVKETDPSVEFGISPAGNIEYAESIGCDLETWFSEDGYIDYVIPQIYWSDIYYQSGRKTEYFSDRLDEWTDLCDYRKPMYIGVALYKSGVYSSADRGWSKRTDNIAGQYELIGRFSCDGIVFFSGQDLFRNEGKKEFANYTKKLTGLNILKKSVTIKKNEKYKLYKQVTIKKKYKSKIRYLSSKPGVASVSDRGVIRAKKKGRAVIYVIGIAGSRVSCNVRVK